MTEYETAQQVGKAIIEEVREEGGIEHVDRRLRAGDSGRRRRFRGLLVRRSLQEHVCKLDNRTSYMNSRG